MEFLIKKSRFKESKCADGGHSLNRDFTVLPCSMKVRYKFSQTGVMKNDINLCLYSVQLQLFANGRRKISYCHLLHLKMTNASITSQKGRPPYIFLMFVISLILISMFIYHIRNQSRPILFTPIKSPPLLRNTKIKIVPEWKERLANTKWCNGIPGYLDPPGPKVALASFPGSGNTWMRYLLQQMTGVLTGSIYTDWKLMSKDFPAGGIKDGRVIATKTHAPYIPKKGQQMMDYDKVILLMRNPWDASLANLNRVQTRSHTTVANPDLIKSKLDKMATNQLPIWRNFHLAWGKNFSERDDNLMLVHYEDLQSNLIVQLRKLSHFLHVSIDEDVFACVILNSEGNFKREKGEITAEKLLNRTTLLKAKEYKDSVLKELIPM